VGKVRPEIVKKLAKELVKRFPDKFTTNFEDNKKVLSSITPIDSVKLRNRIAGYITRLVAISQVAEAEIEQAEEVGEIEEVEVTVGKTETKKET
jgi:small subunit ribosomal protein S17e